jgi:paraquat-inducible protein B
MAKASPRAVGAFVVGGIALLIGGIMAFGSLQFMKPHAVAILYFEEDLSGLDAGAPVTFRGVQIGEVTNIALRYNSTTKAFSSPVQIRVDPGHFQVEGEWPSQLGRSLPVFVQQGLRGQLASQSILTGKRLIELGFHPETPGRLLGAKSDPEVPTIPSQLAELQAGLGGTLRKLEQTPIPELVTDLRGVVQTLGKLLQAVDPASVSTVTDDASAALRTGRDVMERVGKHIDVIGPKSEAAVDHAEQFLAELQKNSGRLTPIMSSIQRAADRADRLLADTNTVIEPGSPTHRELIGMMRDISGAARSMRVLTDDLNRDPNSLLFGKAASRGR